MSEPRFFLKNCLKKLGFEEKKERLLIVPGNHDINRLAPYLPELNERKKTLSDKEALRNFFSDSEDKQRFWTPLGNFSNFINCYFNETFFDGAHYFFTRIYPIAGKARALIRASNTPPKIRLTVQAKNQRRLQKLKEEMMALINQNIKPES